MLFDLKRFHLFGSFLLLLVVFQSCYPCINLISRETIDQEKGEFVAISSLYEGMRRFEHNGEKIESEYSLAIFNNGYILLVPGSNDDFFKKLNEKSDSYIYRNYSGFQWGKYYVDGENLKIEFIGNISSGGGCKIRSLRYEGRYHSESIEIFPGPKNEYKVGPTQHIFPKPGIIFTFRERIPEDLIDPSRARIMR